IEGQSKGRTVYTVTLDASIRDIYGQTLGENKPLTFRVGDATPNLAATAEGLTVLDPYSQSKFSIFSVNHQQLKVSVYAVELQHWSQFSAFLFDAQQRDYRRGLRSMPPIGRLVSSKVIDVASKQDEMTETPIDLKPALPGGFGHVILSVEAVQPPKTEWERRSLQVWIQATNIGLDAFADRTNLLGWTTSLKDGKPLSDVEIAITDPGGVAQTSDKTGADGLARLRLPGQAGQKMLVARKGDDTAFLPENIYLYRRGDVQSEWQKRPLPPDILSWHVFDDRGMYRPGEEVHIKGWLRSVGMGTNGDVAMVGATGVNYILRDSRGNQILNGSARVNALGGFDAAFKLPPTMNLGQAYLMLKAEGGSAAQRTEWNHPIRVQEFRRPEYEVKTTASEGPHFVRDHATLTVAANYYAGGGLADSEVRWYVNATPASFTPPNRGDFIFGKWTPWWEYYGYQSVNTNSKEFTGRTDASGKHRLRIDFDSVTPPRATSVTATANVQDVNRQSVGSSFNFLVHPADLYVGLRTQRWFVQKGEPLIVESIVTDLDGKAVAGREIRMTAALIDWAYDKGEWKERETNPQECVIKSGANATQCRFETREGGRYRITARIYDDKERPNETELTLWVAGGKQPPQRDLAQEKVELIPSGKEYQPGDTAEILVQSPFFPAEGVVTLRRSGLVTSERFTMNSASHTLKIPIKEEYLPNIHLQVDLVGASSRPDDEGKPDPKLPKRPAFASGTINLSIPPATRKLTIAATPRDKELEPGGETTVDVELRDAAGKPAKNAEVALIVVDESVLALSGYKLADPLNTFYFQRGDDVRNHHLREKVQLAKADELISQKNGAAGAQYNAQTASIMPGAMPAPMADRLPSLGKVGGFGMAAKVAGERSEAQIGDTPIQTRIDFNALAFFAASLPTDANGRASVKVKLPDNLTRYRIMAVAVAGDKQFGISESAITARLPIMARPAAPRFLNFGDRVELPVVVQ
ncbi:MAG TPA: alpha-2-macroglobulin family protein, partial [Blastocatellia bacterium]|nr:alpha-2-macroglobulin family protein [Blastocatellia bacterium]